MERIILPLAATLIWAAAASPSPASASPQDYVKARHVKRIQAQCQKKAQRVVKGAQRVVESKSKATKLRAAGKPKRVAKRTRRVIEKANEHGLVQAEPTP